jgi:hypothetical protein
MQNFRFSLEKVLSWRCTELQAEEARLAGLFAERSRLDAARAQIRTARDTAGSRILQAGTIDGMDLASLSGFLRRLDNELIALDRQRALSAEAILKQRARGRLPSPRPPPREVKGPAARRVAPGLAARDRQPGFGSLSGPLAPAVASREPCPSRWICDIIRLVWGVTS